MASANLPLQHISLYAFCRKSKDLLKTNHKHFVKFTLTGVHGDRQYVVNPMLDRMGDEDFGALRDLDSLLGISWHIQVRKPITVYPVGRQEDTLSRDIHLKHEFQNSKVGFLVTHSTTWYANSMTQGLFHAPIHRIPNICLAKSDTHSSIIMLLPELYSEDRKSPYLTQDELETIYDLGTRPAIEELSPGTVAEWPAKYRDEMFRARGSNGQLAFASKMLPAWLVGHLGDRIRAALARNGSTWGTGLVFLHQIRGVKHSTSHSPEPAAADAAFHDFLEQQGLSYGRINRHGTWYVDIGVEFSSPYGRCLAWRTDSHSDMVQEACELGEEESRRLTHIGSSKYARDLVSHLPAVSGCRITTGRYHGPYDIAYMQLYTTDKALTYRPDRATFGKTITAEQILRGKAPAYLQSLITLYNNARETSDGHARVEVRVSIFSATKVLVNLDEDLIRTCLVSIARDVWW